MMTCMYNKNLILQIVDHRGSIEDKNLNLIINNGNDSWTITIRDPSDYIFTYSENIDLGDYKVMRVEQHLEVNFSEFKSILLEMLEQLQTKQMFLKCEISDQLCTLVFFIKSKMKSIVHLTLKLHAASQKEILNEIMNKLRDLKDSNERLQFQVSCMEKSVADKDKEIKQLSLLKNEMTGQFYGILTEVENNINMKAQEVECLLLQKIKVITERIIQIFDDVNHLRRDTSLRSDASTRLLNIIKHLKAENSKKSASIEHLTKENSTLLATRLNMEKDIIHLRYTTNENEIAYRALQSKNEQLRTDMEKATIDIDQGNTTIDELLKDVVEAHQMLVDFNKQYDTKNKACDNLRLTLAAKNELIEEEKKKNYELQRQFEEYKTTFNEDHQERMKHDLIMAQSKVCELEQAIRKTNKIPTLRKSK